MAPTQRFLEHATRQQILTDLGLTPDGLARSIAEAAAATSLRRLRTKGLYNGGPIPLQAVGQGQRS